MTSPYLAFIPQLSCPCTLPLWHFCAVALTCHSWVKSSPALHLCLGPAPCLFGGSASWILALLYAQVPVSASGASPHILLLASPSSGSPLCSWPFPLFSHSLSISLVSWRAESAQSRMAFSRLPLSLPPTSLWSGSSMTFTLPNPVADPYK